MGRMVLENRASLLKPFAMESFDPKFFERGYENNIGSGFTSF